jgi:integrase
LAKVGIRTDRQVSALKPKATPYETSVAEVKGLIVRTFPSGLRSFELRYSAANGTRRRHPLGDYPGLSLAQAVLDAQALRVDVVRGSDPAGERLANRRKAKTGDTLTELAEAYFKACEKGLHGGRGRPKRPATISVEKSRFNGRIKPKLGKRRFAELARADIKQFMRELASEGDLSADSVASVGRTLSSILAFAVHEDRLPSNPVSGLTRPLQLKPRDRMFSDGALRAIWVSLSHPADQPALENDKGETIYQTDPAVALALKLAMMTLARRQDVAGAMTSEIDRVSKTWTIPKERHKSGRPHVIPLTETMIGIFDAAEALPRKSISRRQPNDKPVFPSPTRINAPVAQASLTRALDRLLTDLKLPKGSPHDFRRTGATLLTSPRGGIRRFYVSKVLAHAAQEGAAITGIYDLYEYLAEKRTALEAWEGLLLAIVGERDRSANVLSFSGSGNKK